MGAAGSLGAAGIFGAAGAAKAGLGGTGGGLDFDFRREFFPARYDATAGGEIRAAVAGGDGGTEKTATAVCGAGRRERSAGRRPAENFLATSAQRARDNRDGVAADVSPL